MLVLMVALWIATAVLWRWSLAPWREAPIGHRVRPAPASRMGRVPEPVASGTDRGAGAGCGDGVGRLYSRRLPAQDRSPIGATDTGEGR